jgi:Tol biopolymer transport system component
MMSSIKFRLDNLVSHRLAYSVLLLMCWLLPFVLINELSAQSTCTLPPRLVIGGQGQVTPGEANNVRDIPARSGTKIGEIPAEAVFTVLDGPVCADEFHWWQVDYQGLIGWTVEGSGSDYFVEPVEGVVASTPDPSLPTATPTPMPVVIPPAAYPLEVDNPLEVGATVRIDTDALRMRETPDTDAAVVGGLTMGELVEIVGDRQEADGFIWWQVRRSSGTEGWIIERYVDEDDDFIQTLFPLCPYATSTDRVSFVVHPYLYTAATNGTDRCILTQLRTSKLYTSWRALKYAVNEAYWSPDGQELLYIDYNDGENYTFNLQKISLDGAVRTPLMTQGDVEWAAWSPDGQRIAAVIDASAWVINSDGTRSVQVSQGDERVEYIGWFPDGQRVFYLEAQPDNPNAVQTSTRTTYIFHSIGIDLSQPQTLMTFDGNQEFRDIELSPDGRYVVAVITLLDEYNSPDTISTVLIDLETQEQTEISVSWANWAWSPDGQSLAIRDHIENRILYLETDESISLADFEPHAWSPDGKKLYEVSYDQDTPGFSVYDIETEDITRYLEDEIEAADLRLDFLEGIQGISLPMDQ